MQNYPYIMTADAVSRGVKAVTFISWGMKLAYIKVTKGFKWRKDGVSTTQHLYFS